MKPLVLQPSAPVGDASAALIYLLSMTTNELAGVDIARLNLLCAQGLSGCETVDVTDSVTVLDQRAARGNAEAERHQYRFDRNRATA